MRSFLQNFLTGSSPPHRNPDTSACNMLLSELLTMLIAYCLSMDTIEGAEICYNKLGCFYNTKSGKIRPLPWSPEKINTRFLLHTRDNPKIYQEIFSGNMTSVRHSSFRIAQKTVFIVHGLADAAEDNWVSAMILEILRVEDVNCVGVDWRGGAAHLHLYAQANSNIQVVGGEIAVLVTRLQEELDYPPSSVHLIGHSLGAHAAGEAGKRCRGIGRITGLDPARPHFEDTDKSVHLDSSDAALVDVIHTDADPVFGLGTIKPTGHLDFYPNGGQHMNGCPSKLAFLSSTNLSMKDSVACNHLRAPLYYIESVRNPRGFLSYPCDNYQTFLDGSCFPCPPGGCPPMGHFSHPSHGTIPHHQTFFLHTGGDPRHFSSYRYKVSASLVGKKDISGRIFITLFSDQISSPEYEIVMGTLVPGKRYSGFLDSDVELDEVNCVDFRWTPSLQHQKVSGIRLGVEQVDVQSGGDGRISSFCSSRTAGDNVTLTLGPCSVLAYSIHYYRSDAGADWL